MPFSQEFIIFPLSSVGINLFTFVLVLNLTLIRITWCPVYLCWKGWEISALLFFTAHNIFPVSWESLLCCRPGLSKVNIIMLPLFPSLPFGAKRGYTSLFGYCISEFLENSSTSTIRSWPFATACSVLLPHVDLPFASSIILLSILCPSVNFAPEERLLLSSAKKEGVGLALELL